MFPSSSFFSLCFFLQSIALRATFKKGEQGVSANRNTSTIQECCHHLNIHFWVELRPTNSNIYMQSHVYSICQNMSCSVVPGYPSELF